MNGMEKHTSWTRFRGQPLLKQRGSDCSRVEAISEWITEQLESCSDRHPSCRELESTRLPDRVLDVGLTGQDDVRLKISNGTKFGRYLTLSHRWGDSKFLTLTTECEPKLRQRIPILSLPQTFQDAIEITRSTGLKYLWIDSLCIRQDSPSDWREQSAKMGRIYRDCYFNIAATAASEGGLGLFNPQTPLTFLPLYVWVGAQLGDDASKATPTTEIFQYRNREIVEYSLMTHGTALHRRRWVLQERLLSPRVLNFGNGRMVWECWEKVVLEHNQSLPPGRFSGYDTASFRDAKFFCRWLETLSRKIARFPDIRISLLEQTYRRWQMVIELYSKTHLTNWDDKLIALSGLANLVRKHMRDEYLAGIWRDNLAYDLLWIVPPNSLRPAKDRLKPDLSSWSTGDDSKPDSQWPNQDLSERQESGWRAPTWSWAHIDTPIEHLNDTFYRPRILITFLCSRIIPKSHDVCGQLESAQLMLSGRLIEIQDFVGFDSITSIETLRIRGGDMEWILWADTRSTVEMFQTFDECLKASLAILPVLIEDDWAAGLLLEYDEIDDQYRRLGLVRRNCWNSPFLESEGGNDECVVTLV